MANLPLVKVPIVDYGPDQQAMERYRKEGEERARNLGNRGPIRFDSQGNLDPAIVEAYSRCGFYIFERLLAREELKDIERDVAESWRMHQLPRMPRSTVRAVPLWGWIAKL